VLARIGAFLRENGEAVYATRPGPYQPLDGVYGCTQNGANIYLHALNPAALPPLPPLGRKVLACQTLRGEPVAFTQDQGGIRLQIAERLWQPVDTVVKIIETASV